MANTNVETDHAVLVAQCNQRNITRQVVLGLNDLLLGLGDVGDVGEGKGVGDLLLDGDAGPAGIVFRAARLRVNFDPADAEDFFQAVAVGGVQGLAEDGVGGGARIARVALLLQQRRFFACSPHGQQRDDVGRGQRRLGAVGGVQLVNLAMKTQGDVVIADAGAGLQVQNWFDAHRIAEGDIAALQVVPGAAEVHIAACNVHPAEDKGLGGGAAQAQIGVAGNAGNRGLHVQFGSGGDVHVKPQVVQRRLRVGQSGRRLGARQIAGKVKVTGQLEASKQDIAGKSGAVECTHQVEIDIGGGAHARRITQADVLALGGKVEIQVAVISNKTAQVQQT